VLRQRQWKARRKAGFLLPQKRLFKKFDPVARKHVAYKEAKIK